MSVPLRVGLNLAFAVSDSGGSSRYAHELIPALLRATDDLRLTAFVNAEAPASLTAAAWAGEVEWIRLPNRPTRAGVGSVLTSLGAQWIMLPAIAARRRIALVHGLANVVPPLSPQVATVATVLDVIWLRHANTMGLRGTLGMRLASPISARRADRVIAISESGKRDVVAAFGLPAEKVDVTPLGVSPAGGDATPEPDLRARLGLADDPVVLCTAQLKPHKNLAQLVRAHAQLADVRVRLVLAGPRTGHEQELERLAAELGTAGRLHITGFVSEPDLEGLYGLAACFVLPSLEEGFGLPVLEAMIRRLPVACSDISALPEVAGDAALLFDPRDPGAIAAAVERLLTDRALAEDLVARGIRRASAFSWDATARSTLTSYERALAVRSSTSR
jgi:glycosyltransferase involved in cell wall biosynthesis